MRPRHYVMEDGSDMGTSGTLTYDLDFSDPITELTLLIEAATGATDKKGSPIERCISKIEIVDGGQVLWDCPGDVAFAAFSHINGGAPHCYHTEVGSDTPYVSIPLRFGRFLYDSLYAFNPMAHKNPQLKVTFDEATDLTAGNDGFVSGSFKMDIYAQLMEEATPPIGFLGFREIETFTSLDSGIRRVAFPTDTIIRHLINRVYLTSIDLRNPIKNYKLVADGGRFIPFDLSSGMLATIIASKYPAIEYGNLAMITNGASIQTWMSLDMMGSITSRADDVSVSCANFWPGIALVYAFSHAGADQTDIGAHISVTGWAMHNTLVYPMGNPDAPETWFDAKQFNNLELHLTHGDAGAEVNVVIEQAFTY